jgi:hypothetical protein
VLFAASLARFLLRMADHGKTSESGRARERGYVAERQAGTHHGAGAPADVQRPWLAVESGHVWQVCRPHGQSHTRGASFYFGGKPAPLQFDEADAKALAEMLNLVRPGKYPS